MIEYTIVTAVTEKDLVKLVTDLLADGWQCRGGVSCSHNAVGKQKPTYLFSQALTRNTGKVA